MKQILTIHLEDHQKNTTYLSNEPVSPGTFIVVSTGHGLECEKVISVAPQDSKHPRNLKSIVRVATKEDLQTLKENKEKELQALPISKDCILRHHLDMKLVKIHYTLDRGKMLFYFTADGRVDFRSLVKELASIFRTRIELRQIGVRDESKLLSGFGICGRPFCCSNYLEGFHPVSIKMAKEQGLSLNPTKISGTCGRLMCCLKYEHSLYEEFLKTAIKVGASVQTPDGIGTVCDCNLITQRYQVRLIDHPDAPPRNFQKEEISPVTPRKKSDSSKRKSEKNT